MAFGRTNISGGAKINGTKKSFTVDTGQTVATGDFINQDTANLTKVSTRDMYELKRKATRDTISVLSSSHSILDLLACNDGNTFLILSNASSLIYITPIVVDDALTVTVKPTQSLSVGNAISVYLGSNVKQVATDRFIVSLADETSGRRAVGFRLNGDYTVTWGAILVVNSSITVPTLQYCYKALECYSPFIDSSGTMTDKLLYYNTNGQNSVAQGLVLTLNSSTLAITSSGVLHSTASGYGLGAIEYDEVLGTLSVQVISSTTPSYDITVNYTTPSITPSAHAVTDVTNMYIYQRLKNKKTSTDYRVYIGIGTEGVTGGITLSSTENYPSHTALIDNGFENKFKKIKTSLDPIYVRKTSRGAMQLLNLQSLFPDLSLTIYKETSTEQSTRQGFDGRNPNKIAVIDTVTSSNPKFTLFKAVKKSNGVSAQGKIAGETIDIYQE